MKSGKMAKTLVSKEVFENIRSDFYTYKYMQMWYDCQYENKSQKTGFKV